MDYVWTWDRGGPSLPLVPPQCDLGLAPAPALLAQLVPSFVCKVMWPDVILVSGGSRQQCGEAPGMLPGSEGDCLEFPPLGRWSPFLAGPIVGGLLCRLVTRLSRHE